MRDVKGQDTSIRGVSCETDAYFSTPGKSQQNALMIGFPVNSFEGRLSMAAHHLIYSQGFNIGKRF